MGTNVGARRTLGTLACLPAWVALAIGVWATWSPSEPFFFNDETRHVMTGVFFRDLLADSGWRQPRSYAEQYYLQYPSLGLLVWPPLFYAVLGVVMSAFGTSLIVAKSTVLAFAAMATLYLVALVNRTHGRWVATFAGLLFVLSPVAMELSRQVMLEVPALAFMLAALYYWVAHLDDGSRRALWLAAAAASAAVLVRFDSAVLVPVLLLTYWWRGGRHPLIRRETILAGSAAVAATLPVVWLTAVEFGNVHWATMAPANNAWRDPWALWGALTYYPRIAVSQVGPWALIAAIAGLGVSLSSVTRRRQAAPYLALVAGIYLFFTAIAEKTERHAFPWTAGIAALAGIGLSSLARASAPGLGTTLAATVAVAGTAATTLQQPAGFMRGYEAAAKYVNAHTTSSRYCLFDGFLDGDFVYQIRHTDPTRRLTVLRGDKLLYASVIVEGNQYTEFVSSDDEMAAVLHSYDPEYVVVESPRVNAALPGAVRLRRYLANHPDRYRLEQRFPVDASSRRWDSVSLLVYRSVVRNPTPRRHVELEMLTTGATLRGAAGEPQP